MTAMSPDRGVWITAGWDWNWYDVRPHANELDALRFAANNDGIRAFFVEYGRELK